MNDPPSASHLFGTAAARAWDPHRDSWITPVGFDRATPCACGSTRGIAGLDGRRWCRRCGEPVA